MNFQRLNEFLKKKKDWKNLAATRGSFLLAVWFLVTDMWVH
jgi:hypothetical protein